MGMAEAIEVESSPHGRLGEYDVDEIRAGLPPYLLAEDLRYYLAVKDPFNPPEIPIDPLFEGLIATVINNWKTKKVLDGDGGEAQIAILNVGGVDVAETLILTSGIPHIRPYGQDITGYHPSVVATEIYGGLHSALLSRRQELLEQEFNVSLVNS